MNKKISVIFSLVMIASMLLAACQSATTAPTTETQPTTPPSQATTAPEQPTATTAAVAPTETVAPTPVPHVGAWLDSVVFTAIADQPSAIAQLQAGAIDVYQYTSNDPDLFNTVKADSNLSYANTYGSTDQMIFNTGDYTADGILNPFSDQQFREAMNWAIDRNYLAQEISGGLAIPKFTALTGAFPDAARYAGILGAIATKYAYNFDKATQVVDERMTAMGATKDANGMWQYKDKPVTIIAIIRTEDARKQFGEYFSNQLTKLGFTVDQQEKTSREASPIWTGDVSTYTFGFYTAGWINNSIVRDEGIDFAEFNSSQVFGGGIPVFTKYQPSAELAAAEDKLLTNNFTSMAERDQLFATALNDSMTEGWWGLWLVDNISFTPYSSKVSAASDLAAGLNNPLMPFTLRFNGQEGGTLQMAQPGIFVQAWNPVNGSNWVYDSTPQFLTEDWGTMQDPYTGLALPKLVVKADVIAKTGLPITKNLDWVSLTTQDTIAVPDDAWADWDAKTQTFISAKDRAAADSTYAQTANVEVTVTYTPDLFKTKWHDGTNLSVADFVMAMIQAFDSGKEGSPIYDPASVDVVDTFLSHFKGVKIVSTDPLTITTWDDQYALDAENNAAGYLTWYPSDNNAYAYGTGSWYNQAPAIQAEADGKISMSQDKATTAKIDQTSLISGPTLAIQDEYLTQDVADGYIPYAPTLGQYVTADQAKAAYTNLQAFYTAHNVLWVGTGPYFIDKVDTTAGSITVSKFSDYMFADDQYTTAYSVPKIAVTTVDGPTQVASGSDAQFTVNVSFDNQPYPSTDIDKVSYTLFGSDGNEVANGTATMAAEGQYTIDLTADVTGKLAAGSASLSVAVSSKVVALPSFATYEFVVTK